VRIPGRVQFSGQQTPRRSNPSHPWSPPSPDRLIELIPFILPQIALVVDYFKLDSGFAARKLNKPRLAGV
jgi:hypothetical protein